MSCNMPCAMGAVHSGGGSAPLNGSEGCAMGLRNGKSSGYRAAGIWLQVVARAGGQG